jgi:hypothetical protein
MKRSVILGLLIFIGILSSGCATWNGLKYDSNKAWKSTKRVVHDATAE